ncbi:MAG: hypothetical protein U0V04_19460 [Spirosomataceae bacterium]
MTDSKYMLINGIVWLIPTVGLILFTEGFDKNMTKTAYNTGFTLSGRKMRIETFEQLINFGAGRQFTVSKVPTQSQKPLVATAKK